MYEREINAEPYIKYIKYTYIPSYMLELNKETMFFNARI